MLDWTGFFFVLVVLSAAVHSERRVPLFGHAEWKAKLSNDSNLANSKSNSSWSTFQQFIDHNNPKLGTFSQRYIYNWQFYSGPRAPIILSTPGEDGLPSFMFLNEILNSSKLNDIDLRFSSQTISLVAEKIGAGMVILEHRYYGRSWPAVNTTAAGMKYNTVMNSLLDLRNFAQKAKLPFDLHGTNNAPNVPWVLMGCSMAGALAAWTQKLLPDTFWAYWASSATVLATSSWASTIEIVENLPHNCSADINKVIDRIDQIGVNGSQKEQREIKSLFGLEAIEHFDDFAWRLFRISVGRWQSDRQFVLGLCDAVENVDQKNRTIPGREGVGLDLALAGYARFVKGTDFAKLFVGLDAAETAMGFNSYNTSGPMYTSKYIGSLEADDLSYKWWQSRWPIGYDRSAPPAEYPTIVSRMITEKYHARICDNFFPSNQGEHWTYEQLNSLTGGWSDRKSNRLLYINGEWDGWIHTTISSRFRPGGPMKDTPDIPVKVIPKGGHCSDFSTSCRDDQECNKVMRTAIDQIATWVSTFPHPPRRQKIDS